MVELGPVNLLPDRTQEIHMMSWMTKTLSMLRNLLLSSYLRIRKHFNIINIVYNLLISYEVFFLIRPLHSVGKLKMKKNSLYFVQFLPGTLKLVDFHSLPSDWHEKRGMVGCQKHSIGKLQGCFTTSGGFTWLCL